MSTTHHIDAAGKSLGRLATEAALLLRGKRSPDFTRHLASGDTVKITNAAQVKLSGTKTATKKYSRYTGHPGGLRQETPAQVIVKKGHAELIRRAVQGMLPANRLRRDWLKHLIITE